MRGRLIVHSKHLVHDVDVQDELQDLVAKVQCNDRVTAVQHKLIQVRKPDGRAERVHGVGQDMRIRCLLLKKGGQANAAVVSPHTAHRRWFDP